MIPKLPEFFVSYGSYHNNWVNKLIHIICIPQIYFSLCALMKHWTTTTFNIMGWQVDYMFFFLLAVFLVYLKVDFISGVLSTLIYGALYFLSNHIWMHYKSTGQADLHFKIFLIQHIVCWLLQFVGHGVFEKRNPALMDNLLLTLVAPDFVILEILFLFGYKREIHEGCSKQIVENIRVFHEGKVKKAK